MERFGVSSGVRWQSIPEADPYCGITSNFWQYWMIEIFRNISPGCLSGGGIFDPTAVNDVRRGPVLVRRGPAQQSTQEVATPPHQDHNREPTVGVRVRQWEWVWVRVLSPGEVSLLIITFTDTHSPPSLCGCFPWLPLPVRTAPVDSLSPAFTHSLPHSLVLLSTKRTVDVQVIWPNYHWTIFLSIGQVCRMLCVQSLQPGPPKLPKTKNILDCPPKCRLFVWFLARRIHTFMTSMLLMVLIHVAPNVVPDVEPSCWVKHQMLIEMLIHHVESKQNMLIEMLIHHVESKNKCWSRCWSIMLSQNEDVDQDVDPSCWVKRKMLIQKCWSGTEKSAKLIKLVKGGGLRASGTPVFSFKKNGIILVASNCFAGLSKAPKTLH